MLQARNKPECSVVTPIPLDPGLMMPVEFSLLS
jgi:hypothetical protein